MTSFSNLPQITQDLIMLQFEFFGKIFIMIFFLTVAVLYIYYWHKKKKDTPYYLVALVRVWLYALSWILIGFTPLLLLFLYPQKSIDDMLGPMFLFYRYAIIVIFIIMFANLLFYGPLVLAKLGGLDIQSKNTNKVLDQFLGKYKKYFRRG